ncbi:hypothetical protein [Bradyrhizobium sp. CCGUVB23]
MAFLLRPHESHGLGDTFLKSLMRRALENVPGTANGYPQPRFG